MSEAGSLSTEADGSRTSPPSPGRGAAEAELERVAAAERRDRGVTGRGGDTRGRGVKCREWQLFSLCSRYYYHGVLLSNLALIVPKPSKPGPYTKRWLLHGFTF